MRLKISFVMRAATVLLTAVVLVAVLGVATADAARPRPNRDGVSGCRRDPIVTLSNGVVVQMTAVIGAQLSDVRRISYTLHAPQGTTVERVVYTGGVRHPSETFEFFADAPAGHYSTETTVSTASRGTPVTAITRIGEHSGSATGVSEQTLAVNLDI